VHVGSGLRFIQQIPADVVWILVDHIVIAAVPAPIRADRPVPRDNIKEKSALRHCELPWVRWAGQFDLIGILAVGGRAGRTVSQGAVRVLPNLPFSFVGYSQSELFRNPYRPASGQVVAHVLKTLVELDVVDLSLGPVVNVSVSAATPWRRS